MPSRSFTANPALAHEVSDWSGRLLLEAGLAPDRRGLAEIAIVEAFINIARHGYHERKGNAEIEISSDESSVAVTLSDTAQEFNPTSVTAKDRQGNEEHGMGLTIIREAADDVIYKRKDGRNHLTLRFSRSPAQS